MIPSSFGVKNKLYAGLPEAPGVYLMKDRRGRVLYIGKAGNLRRRVSSYFCRPHDSRIQKMVSLVKGVDFRRTDTAIEALILEAKLIKKLAPPFNVREKDDKSFLFVEITREDFPRVLLVRGKQKPSGERFGPFTSAGDIRAALRILRRIFPWSTHPSVSKATSRGKENKRPCFDYEIGLCPGTCVGLAERKEYLKNIRNLKLFFKGKKERILRQLEKEMAAAAKNLNFERAEKLKRQIFALKHIQDIALIKDGAQAPDPHLPLSRFRIEGYDISNISGTSAVGAMAVFSRGKPDKNEYRRFKIQSVIGSNDVAMLQEVIRRRFKNPWPLPNLILVDGGKAQVNAVKIVLAETGLKIPVVGIAKGVKRKRTDVLGKIPPGVDLKTLVRLRDEAHRFAIAYHKKLRSKKLFE
jgi:excinuclease ABC subunit C